MKKYLVFDVGGTFVKYAVMDENGEILEKGKFPTPMTSQEDFIQALGDVYGPVQDEVEGIAFSLPGGIDVKEGFIRNPGALLYNASSHFAKALQDALHDRFGKDVTVAMENDGRCAALAELWKGNLSDVNDGAVMILGTGIGGGIIVNRQVLHGRDIMAGEMSFLLGDIEKKGMANTLAGQASAISLCKQVAGAKGLEGEDVDGFAVFKMLEEQDEEAWKVFNSVCDRLAGTIYNLEVIINPERVLIGGGISQQPLVLQTIREKADAYFDAMNQEGFHMPRPEIDVCAYFNDSNMLGALYNLFENPILPSAAE